MRFEKARRHEDAGLIPPTARYTTLVVVGALTAARAATPYPRLPRGYRFLGRVSLFSADYVKPRPVGLRLYTTDGVDAPSGSEECGPVRLGLGFGEG